jgi:hypothetical protein
MSCAECCDLVIGMLNFVMLSVVMLGVIMPSVVMLGVVMLSVVAPSILCVLLPLFVASHVSIENVIKKVQICQKKFTAKI